MRSALYRVPQRVFSMINKSGKANILVTIFVLLIVAGSGLFYFMQPRTEATDATTKAKVETDITKDSSPLPLAPRAESRRTSLPESRPNTPASVVDINIPRRVRGRVIDESGAPLAKWTVEYLYRQRRQASTFTDKEGLFTFEDCGPVSFTLQVFEYKARSRNPAAEVQLARPVEDEITIRITNEMRPSASVSGIVKTANGLPAAGAHVELFDSPMISISAICDEQGKFIIQKLSAGKYRPIIAHPGFVTFEGEWKSLAASESWNLGTITLGEGGSLLVEIASENPELLRGVTVRMIPVKNGFVDPMHVRSVTATDNRANFDAIESGSYYLSASSWNASSTSNVESVQIVELSTTPARLILQKGRQSIIEFERSPATPLVEGPGAVVISGAGGRPVHIHTEAVAKPIAASSIGCVLNASDYTFELQAGGVRVAGGNLHAESQDRPEPVVIKARY